MFFLILDIGQDGTGLTANARFARDAAALMLQYYDGDYAPVAGTGTFNLFSADAVGLYNGNIAALSTATDSVTPLLKLFRYDKLNRIKQMQTAGVSAGEWGSLTDNFSTEYRYDYNGNILSLQRKDANAVLMHQINYTYNAKNNRLQAITAVGINNSNYSYDAIGNLTNDNGENISVTWNAMNKVKTVVTPNSTLHFAYSPTGQRQIKKTGDKTEYYLHDATGNIMCVYELSGNYLTVKERTIYGSKRIGVYRQRIRFGISSSFIQVPGTGLINILHPQPVIGPDGRHYLEGSNRLQVIGVNRAIAQTSTISYTYKKGTAELKGLSPLMAVRPTFLDGNKTAGLRDYELTDHLSNVMAVISDRKLSVDTNSDTITDYYAPQVVSYTDYYPFGFPMAERSGNLSGYRFGFNGQEADNEIYGVKTTYAFEYRMQDTRLGRFWSVDPLARNYPWNSTYAFAENRVIDAIELEGLEKVLINPTESIIYKGGQKFTENSAVHIVAHGNKNGIRNRSSDLSQKSNFIDTKEEFTTLLKTTDNYKNLQNSNKLVIVLHSCNTGVIGGFAQKMSEQLNITIIAPDVQDRFVSSGEIGPQGGNWLVYKGGVVTAVYDEKWSPKGVPTAMENYKYKRALKYSVTSSSLNLRTGAGTSFSTNGDPLEQGTILTPTGNANNGWAEVTTEDGRTGWVSAQYTQAHYGQSSEQKGKEKTQKKGL